MTLHHLLANERWNLEFVFFALRLYALRLDSGLAWWLLNRRVVWLLNVRLMGIEAAYFLEFLLPPACATALHIYFADPWPKRRHIHHRLVGERFPALAARVLTPGGTVWLRTDNTDYFAQMTEVFAAARDFAPVETPAALAEIRTDFEREFNARGIPTNRAGYRLAG